MVSTETILMGLLTVLAIFIVSEGMLDIRFCLIKHVMQTIFTGSGSQSGEVTLSAVLRKSRAAIESREFVPVQLC
jgi:hypothetical protein